MESWFKLSWSWAPQRAQIIPIEGPGRAGSSLADSEHNTAHHPHMDHTTNVMVIAAISTSPALLSPHQAQLNNKTHHSKDQRKCLWFAYKHLVIKVKGSIITFIFTQSACDEVWEKSQTHKLENLYRIDVVAIYSLRNVLAFPGFFSS